ncbi:lysyl oxidase family protein [Nannocystis sp. SCPEA4]|uniref:lysyl oxidase family protein n=1 Tax=Nannocystis sp. SCPEA4 TaxID=2996787 RepID=UPI00226ED288|nr:lysyl oxidase family protein [Nannocystis sp. SCPEA4]
MSDGPRGRCTSTSVALCGVAVLLACGREDVTTTQAASTSGTSTGRESTSGDVSTGTSSTGAPTTGPTGVDELPPAPFLVSPVDGATDVSTAIELCWKPVVDPEGEPVRYRVFVDDTELTHGILGEEPGYPGPCVGPLDLKFETTYSWQVQAFEADDLSRGSQKRPAWSFTTRPDGLTGVVFEEEFDGDFQWQIDGDAVSGAWVRGNPEAATHAGNTSQPERCYTGNNCIFTGHNPDGLADAEDVAGGSTIVTSPEFDLAGAATATVELRRYFYKSEPGAGSSLTVELLVPDEDAPDGYVAHELERLDVDNALAPANLWTPREYGACGVPMVAGSRLRLTATDQGAGILEAAIDSVTVRAHAESTICASAPGGLCDPGAGPAACPDELLCCSQGVLNTGVYRCTTPVAGLDFADPPATPESPGTGPLGCDAPDLIVDDNWISPIFHEIMADADTCEVGEGCLGGLGMRRLMLFTAAMPNIGSADLVMGIPANHPELYHYSACHDHYHFDEFARYELRDSEGQMVVATGHKQAFCMLDTISWAWPLALPRFDCANQGISRGFTDHYEAGLPCQWVDITGLAPGEYVLRISVNQPRPDAALPLLNERVYDNNTIEVPVTVP